MLAIHRLCPRKNYSCFKSHIHWWRGTKVKKPKDRAIRQHVTIEASRQVRGGPSPTATGYGELAGHKAVESPGRTASVLGRTGETDVNEGRACMQKRITGAPI